MEPLGHFENILLKMKNVSRKEATVLGIMPPHLAHSAGRACPHEKALLLFHSWNNFPKRKAPLDFAKLPKIWFQAGTVGNLALA